MMVEIGELVRRVVHKYPTVFGTLIETTTTVLGITFYIEGMGEFIQHEV